MICISVKSTTMDFSSAWAGIRKLSTSLGVKFFDQEVEAVLNKHQLIK
jgi:hypothetical protein